VKEGDHMKVKLIGTDPKSGKFKLSRKILMPKPESAPRPPHDGEEESNA
jgi:polyribonucleotide nucleotidyltransferase